jgi:hypothetical protein
MVSARRRAPASYEPSPANSSLGGDLFAGYMSAAPTVTLMGGLRATRGSQFAIRLSQPVAIGHPDVEQGMMWEAGLG